MQTPSKTGSVHMPCARQIEVLIKYKLGFSQRKSGMGLIKEA